MIGEIVSYCEKALILGQCRDYISIEYGSLAVSDLVVSDNPCLSIRSKISSNGS